MEPVPPKEHGCTILADAGLLIDGVDVEVRRVGPVPIRGRGGVVDLAEVLA